MMKKNGNMRLSLYVLGTMKCDECYFIALIILLDYCLIAQLLCFFLLLRFSEACVDVGPSLIPNVYIYHYCVH